MRHQVRTKFDPDRKFTPRRQMTVSGAVFYPGEEFDKSLLTDRRLRQFFDARKLVYLEGAVAGGRMTEEETAKTHRGAHAARATQNITRHASHFAALDKKRAAAKAEALANAKPEKRKRNSPETIRGLKPTETPAAPAPKGKTKAKAAAPKKVEKPKTTGIDTKGAEFKARMEAARAAAAARRAAAEASASEKPEDAAPPPPPPAADTATPEPAQSAPAGAGKPLKPLSKGEKVKDPAAIAAARAAIVIPDDWASLEFNALSELAAQLTDVAVKSKAIAIKVISEEVARRGTA